MKSRNFKPAKKSTSVKPLKNQSKGYKPGMNHKTGAIRY